MNLFSNLNNILPYDGEAIYYGPIINDKKAYYYFNDLLNKIQWQHDEVIIYGKRIVTKRKVALYADSAYKYSYSNSRKIALPWTATLLELKDIVESQSKESYNSCLLNLYHNGSEGMAWHSDDEKTLRAEATIASLSLGAERVFSFKHKEKKIRESIVLQNGSLLLMKGAIQKNWLHHLAPSTKVKTARINLTFRNLLQH